MRRPVWDHRTRAGCRMFRSVAALAGLHQCGAEFREGEFADNRCAQGVAQVEVAYRHVANGALVRSSGTRRLKRPGLRIEVW